MYSNLKEYDFFIYKLVVINPMFNLTKNICSSKHLPGKFFELNIFYGLFIGDHSRRNNTDMFFGHVRKFRGCLSEVSDLTILIKNFRIICTQVAQHQCNFGHNTFNFFI